MRNPIVLAIALGISVGVVALADPHRVDCTFFNSAPIGVSYEADSSTPVFCYASATYDADLLFNITDLHYGVGCDNETLYDDSARHFWADSNDWIVPPTAATPKLSIPALTQDAGLAQTGLHDGTLVTIFGTMTGTNACVVD